MTAGKSVLSIRKQGDIAIVGFLTPSILDQATVNGIGAELMALADEQNCRKVLIDLSGVKYFSSSMVGRLIALHKKMGSAGGGMKLCSINPSIMEIFTTMRLHKVFDIQPDESAGVAKFGGGL